MTRSPTYRTFPLHAADFVILQRVTQLRQPFLEVVGKQRGANQVLGLLFVVNAPCFFDGVPPFFLCIVAPAQPSERQQLDALRDRKSTRLNSSHLVISY